MAAKKKKPLLRPVRAPYFSGGETAERWWECDEADVWKNVWATVDAIDERQAQRRLNWQTFRKFYENHGTSAVTNTDGRLPLVWADGRLTLNVIRSCIATVSAKISQEKPRAFFLTSGADFGLQQKAEKLTRYMEGAFTATDIYEHGQDVFTDICVYGTGAMRLFIDGDKPDEGDEWEDDRTVKAERVLITELVVDDREAIYGKPLQIHQRRVVAKDTLIARHPDKREAIMAAPSYVAEGGYGSMGKDDGAMVEVVESWHLRSGKRADDGRHSLCIKGEDGTIFCEPYEKSYLPFVFLYWSRPLSGFWGIGLCEELLGVQKEINRLLMDIHVAQKNATPTILVEAGSDVNADHFDNDRRGRIVKYKGTQPVFSTPAALNPEMYQHLERLWSKGFELAGVSQLSAGGKKPPGLDAAVAMREYQDIETGRFVLQGQRYEKMYMKCAEVMVDLSKDIFADNRKLKVKARSKFGKKFITSIPWKEVDLEEDQYEMQVYPVSQLPRTPSARMQTVTELMQQTDENGKPLISGAMALQLLNFPDLEEFMDLKTASLNVIRMHIDKMLTGEAYVAPLPFMDLKLAVEMAQMSILLAMLNETPEEAIENVMRYANACQELMGADVAELAPPKPVDPAMVDPSLMPPPGMDPSMMQMPMPPPAIPMA